QHGTGASLAEGEMAGGGRDRRRYGVSKLAPRVGLEPTTHGLTGAFPWSAQVRSDRKRLFFLQLHLP
ncbi:MAG: hypothetical protein AB7O21_20125, partial [Gammaproteobacteria bacterium]